MDFTALLILAVLGLSFGSFVNAAVWRLKHKRDIIKDRSECVHCHHKLAWYDLIPVISWVLLKGKCRYCKKPISWQYPVVELFVAAYFVFSYILWPHELLQWHQQLEFGLWLVEGVMLAILFVYDLKWFLLPDKVVYPLIAVAAVDALVRVVTNSTSFGAAATDIGLSLAVIGGFYWVLHMASKGSWVGFGDVKLGVVLGLALGWQLAIVCLMVANLIGFLVVVPGLVTRKLNRSSRVPFGPFLIGGFVIAGLFGDAIIDAYFGMLLF